MNDCCCTNQLAPIYKGDDVTITLVIIEQNGSKMNFNGKTIKFILKKNKNEQDSQAVILKIYTPTEDMTQLCIHLTKEDTDITQGIYWYGIRVISGDYQSTEGEGKVEIRQGPFYGQ